MNFEKANSVEGTAGGVCTRFGVASRIGACAVATLVLLVPQTPAKALSLPSSTVKPVPGPAPVCEPRPGPTPSLTIPPKPVAVAPPLALVRSPAPYTVRPGNSLWQIAEAHLGEGERWQEIWVLNQDRPQGDEFMTAPDLIRPGWSLLLPPDATGLPEEPLPAKALPTAKAPPKAPTPPPSPSPCRTFRSSCAVPAVGTAAARARIGGPRGDSIGTPFVLTLVAPC
jgi:hypothetical protein